MHGLHPQHLIVTLLIIEHRGCKIVEHVLIRKWTVSLGSIKCNDAGADRKGATDLYPFVPDEESVAIVVWGMEVVQFHCLLAVNSIEVVVEVNDQRQADRGAFEAQRCGSRSHGGRTVG